MAETIVEVSRVDALCGKLTETQKDLVGIFLQSVSEKYAGETLNSQLIDSYIERIDQALSDQMDEILHNEEFQRMESTWRGLHHLVQTAKFDKQPIKIEILDVSKKELHDDLQLAAKGEGYEKQSGLWHHIYWNAYDKVGGHPYTTVISDYQFENSMQDIGLLTHMAVLCERTQLPFISSASAKFFGEKDMTAVMNNHNLAKIVTKDDEFIAWRAFREQDNSRYIGLALPRFLGRLPYSPENEATENFVYQEGVYKEGKDHSLWVNAAFALTANMIKSYEKWGWTVKIVGEEYGRVTIPSPIIVEKGKKKQKVPVEASVGMRKDTELCDMGFVPLAHWENTDYACFFQIPSTKKAKEFKDDPDLTADERIISQLQYTMLVTRIAHYLRYRQLLWVGRNATAEELKNDLTQWLAGITHDSPNPPEDIVARRPLRSFKLDVIESPSKPGFYQIMAEFRPHVAIIGFDILLKLVAFHSKKEK